MPLPTPRGSSAVIQHFHRFFCFCFALLFSWLFLGVLFENRIYSFNTLGTIVSILGWLIATTYLYRWLSQREALLARREKPILVICLLLLFTGQLTLGYWLAVETSWDTEAVYRGALNLALQGNLGNYRDYFHIFPHNLGATSLLGLLFSIGKALGVEDLYWLGTIYNVVSLTLGSVLVYGIGRELKDVKHGLLALWFMATCLPLQFYTPVFYTDTLSLPFVAGVYYGYLRLLKQQIFYRRLVLGICIGVLCALGALIKFSVAIVGVAVLADLLIRGQLWRQRYSVVAALIIFFCLAQQFYPLSRYAFTRRTLLRFETGSLHTLGDDGAERQWRLQQWGLWLHLQLPHLRTASRGQPDAHREAPGGLRFLGLSGIS